MLTGTILGGPQDGEILVADHMTVLMPEDPVEYSITTVEKSPPLRGPSVWKNHLYDFRRDDDGRGWWVRRP
jgi:hypothetical protein